MPLALRRNPFWCFTIQDEGADLPPSLVKCKQSWIIILNFFFLSIISVLPTVIRLWNLFLTYTSDIFHSGISCRLNTVSGVKKILLLPIPYLNIYFARVIYRDEIVENSILQRGAWMAIFLKSIPKLQFKFAQDIMRAPSIRDVSKLESKWHCACYLA